MRAINEVTLEWLHSFFAGRIWEWRQFGVAVHQPGGCTHVLPCGVLLSSSLSPFLLNICPK